jgi:general secretion pathway protein M
MRFLDLSFLDRLSRRERLVLLVGAIVLLGFGLWGLSNMFQWYQNRIQTLDRLIEQKQQDRMTLVRLRHEHGQIKDEIRKLEDRINRDQANFSLLSYLESTSSKLAMRSHITQMRPQPASDVDGYREVGVEIKMDNVTLDQIIRLLSAIETAPHLIRIKRLRLQTQFSDPRLMKATFLATTYEKGGTR